MLLLHGKKGDCDNGVDYPPGTGNTIMGCNTGGGHDDDKIMKSREGTGYRR